MPPATVNELLLDHKFWEAISTNADFQRWLLERSKFIGKDLQLVIDEKWHQRWYRSPITKRDSETDILLVYRDCDTHERYAFHIENKPDHRTWEPGQAAEYRLRAEDRKSKWRYVDYQTILLAPASFLQRWPFEAAMFDFTLSYDAVAAFVPDFGIQPVQSK